MEGNEGASICSLGIRPGAAVPSSMPYYFALAQLKISRLLPRPFRLCVVIMYLSSLFSEACPQDWT
ncbi:hypothetical protein K438DRAFT_1807576 [Mycena galopus ATCC 62051]|nr:hypothetical protein K438DRAFT_1807576 [Mycena galopus ATCC 62051]